MTKAAKGPQFERWLCEQLSLWWTKDLKEPRTDIFWRTSNSGGRATNRGKKGKRTKGQYGDIAAIDPIGQPLLDLLTIEVKRGYNKYTITDLLDRPEKAAKQKYETWIEKAIHDHELAGSMSWLLIVKRDRREPMVILPMQVFKELTSLEIFWEIHVDIGGFWLELAALRLEYFLLGVYPKAIQRTLKHYVSMMKENNS